MAMQSIEQRWKMPKHVFFIICDELRYDALSCNGNKIVNTKNIDALAKDSVNFHNCYCDAPMCVPSRVSIATGRYSLSHGALDNMLTPLMTEQSLYTKLQSSGVNTINHGKWHTNISPDKFGLDVNNTGEAQRDFPEKYISPFGIREPSARENVSYTRNYGEIPLVLHGTRPTKAEKTLDSIVTQNYLDEIENIAKSNAPTFARLSILDPHSPYFPAKPYDAIFAWQDMVLPESFEDSLQDRPLLQQYFHKGRGFDLLKQEDFKKCMAAYYGLVAHTDDRIGQVISHLKKHNLYDDSMIIFTSDHGCMLGEHKFIEKWGHMYEPVVHCPLLIKMPKGEFANTERNTYVQSIDIMPTVLDYYNISPSTKIHGKSVLPLIKGEVAKLRDKVFAQYFCASLQSEPALMVRDEKYKLTIYPGQELLEQALYLDHPLRMTDFFDSEIIEGELYDMQNDKGEQKNLFNNDNFVDVKKTYINYITKWKESLNGTAQIPQHIDVGKFGMFTLLQGGNMKRASNYFKEHGTHSTYSNC